MSEKNPLSRILSKSLGGLDNAVQLLTLDLREEFNEKTPKRLSSKDLTPLIIPRKSRSFRKQISNSCGSLAESVLDVSDLHFLPRSPREGQTLKEVELRDGPNSKIVSPRDGPSRKTTELGSEGDNRKKLRRRTLSRSDQNLSKENSAPEKIEFKRSISKSETNLNNGTDHPMLKRPPRLERCLSKSDSQLSRDGDHIMIQRPPQFGRSLSKSNPNLASVGLPRPSPRGRFAADLRKKVLNKNMKRSVSTTDISVAGNAKKSGRKTSLQSRLQALYSIAPLPPIPKEPIRVSVPASSQFLEVLALGDKTPSP